MYSSNQACKKSHNCLRINAAKYLLLLHHFHLPHWSPPTDLPKSYHLPSPHHLSIHVEIADVLGDAFCLASPCRHGAAQVQRPQVNAWANSDGRVQIMPVEIWQSDVSTCTAVLLLELTQRIELTHSWSRLPAIVAAMQRDRRWQRGCGCMIVDGGYRP